MVAPYGLEIVESCLTCKFRGQRTLCNLRASALEKFDKIKWATTYPRGSVLFVEGQNPRGVFVLCKGRVKLSMSSPDGKTYIANIAQPGEPLGLGAAISGKPYDLSAETLDHCQINFIRREDFLRFMADQSDFCFRVAELLSQKYNHAFHEIRALLSHTAAEKIAVLLLDWAVHSEGAVQEEPRVRLLLTQQEIAQKIGTSRETVTRFFAELKKRQIIQSKRGSLVIANESALRSMAGA